MDDDDDDDDYPDVCLQLNMFRAFSRPSSEAQ
jgi:hypothetical protein